MEHYHKISSQLVEKTPEINEIRISSTGKPQDIIHKAISITKEYPKEGVVISACGNDVTKAVTIIEQIKKKYPYIYQHAADICYNRVEDLWQPDLPGLDNLKVIRKIPLLQITLVQQCHPPPPPKQEEIKQTIGVVTVQSSGKRKKRSHDITTKTTTPLH